MSQFAMEKEISVCQRNESKSLNKCLTAQKDIVSADTRFLIMAKLLVYIVIAGAIYYDAWPFVKDHVIRGPMSLHVRHYQNSYCLKAVTAEPRPRVCCLPSGMMTSLYKWNIPQQDAKQYTLDQSTILTKDHPTITLIKQEIFIIKESNLLTKYRR